MIKENNGKIKAWSAGCSTGEEPYTLAIILDTLGVLHSSTIHAGDFDEDALSKAKLGIYPDKSLVNIPDNIKSKYFKKVERR